MKTLKFSVAIDGVLNKTKTVTRRRKDPALKKGDIVQAVDGTGKAIGQLQIVSVRKEQLNELSWRWKGYGVPEMKKEGFDKDPVLKDPTKFVDWFAKQFKCEVNALVSRVEFKYV